ncbi:MAG: hypothetical protein B7Y48_03705 [Methylophilales bacterium 28-44-11]|nr:MAG: hypothetical protein B7Y48_03705 [Methylophilales bacterium 28-44-11]
MNDRRLNTANNEYLMRLFLFCLRVLALMLHPFKHIIIYMYSIHLGGALQWLIRTNEMQV